MTLAHTIEIFGISGGFDLELESLLIRWGSFVDAYVQSFTRTNKKANKRGCEFQRAGTFLKFLNR